jgi:hypothetical protein
MNADFDDMTVFEFMLSNRPGDIKNDRPIRFYLVFDARCSVWPGQRQITYFFLMAFLSEHEGRQTPTPQSASSFSER